MSGTNEIEVLADSQVTILSERRRHAAWGAARGTASEAGTNLCIERRSARLPLPDKITFHAHAGDGVRSETPGGGGYGREDEPAVAMIAKDAR